ncbi:hypothetical protein MMUR_64410 [Mycolicibacterium murale]|uniref:DNA-binding protein n=1 Tax=Mycolicibacterium murale TaxID=182220 RepID=A0A7I9WX50_9MYCO|nr:OB-fold domain-containing protein [Mycolicibacterium murale]MCV7182005.1 OB-fold domain-containing protein [Mycolicibacterium murale]GFG62305.1 hypothetical protein MMUR_64410 [Mycolicibacterium murale]
MTAYITPDHGDPISRPFWEGLTRGCLSFQHCPDCGYVRFPAAERCPECWTPGGDWHEVAAAGTVWSHTTYHRALHPALAAAVPYRVLLVELDIGPVLPGRLIGETPPQIGARVAGVFTRVTDSFTMLDWQLER